MSESAAPADTNAKAYSVSELAFALKRTIENAYGFVRLRGELSKVTFHSGGHVYLDLKDDKAAISGVIWRTTVPGLKIKPQTGMEVIVTGKITTYPGRSQYQIIIESMEPAGMGALLAQLERLKARLQAEGLFEPSRKQRIPSIPAVVGVVTSPTGAVIRDILHRIRERWPCRVLVWPVTVQGDTAAAQVTRAIQGFGALEVGGRVPRPDLLIVARGGGSVEDLWPFNDEALARAVAACTIPLISAVGHETDTTLIDFVSDRRAPTPTAAAEMATPVLAELKAQLANDERRLIQCASRALESRRTRLIAAERGLPRPADLIGMASQRFDIISGKLGSALEKNLAVHRQDLIRVTANLRPALLLRSLSDQIRRTEDLWRRAGPCLTRRLERADEQLAGVNFRPALLQQPIEAQTRRLDEVWRRATPILPLRTERARERLTAVDKVFASLNPDAPLARGFARIHRASGRLALRGADLDVGEKVKLVFADGARDAVVDGAAPRGKGKAKVGDATQGDLFAPRPVPASQLPLD